MFKGRSCSLFSNNVCHFKPNLDLNVRSYTYWQSGNTFVDAAMNFRVPFKAGDLLII